MKRILYATICLVLGAIGILQAQNDDHPLCGTTEETSRWLEQYQRNPGAYPKSDGIIYVPTTIHNVGNESGGGFVSLAFIQEALCAVNKNFEPTGIQFYIKDTIRYVYRQEYYDHPDFATGRQMIEENFVPNTLNTYIVFNPAGAAGYAYLSSDILVLGSRWIGPGTGTWEHEIGHALSLPHTFRGWERFEHFINQRAPRQVNGVLVEKADGSNCYQAGDGFCDTPPDYLNRRWNCNSDRLSAQQLDPDSVPFRSDGTLFMSYANDACMNRFSDEQIAAMRANLLTQKAAYFENQRLTPLIDEADTVFLQFPAQAQIVSYEQVPLEWEPLEGATHYIIEVSRLSSFPSSSLTRRFVITSENNTLTVNGLENNRNYFWRVRAFNGLKPCDVRTSAIGTFRTSDLTNLTTIKSLEGIRVYPTLLHAGETLRIELDMPESTTMELRMLDVSGKLLKAERLQVMKGTQTIRFQTVNVPKGIYLLSFVAGDRVYTSRIAIQ